jgi:gamma-glutamyltranspeptidase/glutathione hydrolase
MSSSRNVAVLFVAAFPLFAAAQMRTQKPVIHGSHWVAVTGKPIAATAGAMIFQKGGNAVDAAVAMIAATCTIWDTLSWGGETQALIYDPKAREVVGVNGLGVAPSGATPELFEKKGMKYPPSQGPLAAVTPGTPGAIFMMLAKYGRLSLKDVLAPAIELADGYPMEIETSNVIERHKALLEKWPYSRAVMLPHHGEKRPGPAPGEMFRQPELAATLRKLVEAEQKALRSGKSRQEAIQAAHDRFYKGDIAKEFSRGVQEQGGLITQEDLAKWRPQFEKPVRTTYRGIDVYKLTVWTQGPVMLQALNILENFDLKTMGLNTSRYIHTVYQAMNLAFADRDFYYGDPQFPPAEPVAGLLSKEYARERAKLINPERNDPSIGPGDPYAFQGEKNPYGELLRNWASTATKPAESSASEPTSSVLPSERQLGPARTASATAEQLDSEFYLGTTSVEAADAEGWVVSVTPSGGWIPAVIAGHTGIGLSQRMQSFVTNPAENPFNVIAPGKHPRVTLTPTLAFKNGKPFLCFSVQGGDSQDQNLLQFFLDMVEFGLNVQEAAEGPNFNSFQMRSSFGNHETRPGRILLSETTPAWVRRDLKNLGYTLTFGERTSGPINAIFFDQAHGTFWGGSSNHGDDYGIGW